MTWTERLRAAMERHREAQRAREAEEVLRRSIVTRFTMQERRYFETTHIGMPRLCVLTDSERTTLTVVLREWRERLWKRGSLSADSYVEAAQRHEAIVKSMEVH